MDTASAADLWVRAWESGWRSQDPDIVAAVYAPNVVYRSHPFRPPEHGGARGYAERAFAEEGPLELVQFGMPLVTGDRAAVEWWAIVEEGGTLVTLAGTSVLRFDGNGKVVEHLDYWVSEEGSREPPPGWGT